MCYEDTVVMKAKQSYYHIGTAPTARARCRKCKRQVQKGSTRIVTTAFVKHNHTVRFTRCVLCIDAKLAAAIVNVYGSATRIQSTPDVTPDKAEEIRATIAHYTRGAAITPAATARARPRPANNAATSAASTTATPSPTRCSFPSIEKTEQR